MAKSRRIRYGCDGCGKTHSVVESARSRIIPAELANERAIPPELEGWLALVLVTAGGGFCRDAKETPLFCGLDCLIAHREKVPALLATMAQVVEAEFSAEQAEIGSLLVERPTTAADLTAQIEAAPLPSNARQA
jgi:hypothetical protein